MRVLGKRYVVSLGKEQKAFVFSKQVDACVTRDFEGLINHYAMLLFANDGHEPEWIGNEIYAEEAVADEIHKSMFFNKDTKITTAAGVAAGTKPKSEYELSEKIGNAFTVGGQFIMKGLSKAGEFIGTGIRNSSDAIKKLVGKNEKPVEVQPATVAKFRAASQTTKAVTSF